MPAAVWPVLIGMASLFLHWTSTYMPLCVPVSLYRQEHHDAQHHE